MGIKPIVERSVWGVARAVFCALPPTLYALLCTISIRISVIVHLSSV